MGSEMCIRDRREYEGLNVLGLNICIVVPRWPDGSETTEKKASVVVRTHTSGDLNSFGNQREGIRKGISVSALDVGSRNRTGNPLLRLPTPERWEELQHSGVVGAVVCGRGLFDFSEHRLHVGVAENGAILRFVVM